MALAIACWTPLFSIAKRTLPLLDAFALGTVRYALGVALFVALLAAVEGRGALRFDGRWLLASAVGLVGITGFNLFIWIGLGYTRPEHASIILALQSPLTALAVWVLRGQRPAPFTLGCVAVAIAGVVLVISKGDLTNALAGGSLLGDALILLGAISWVTYTLAASRFPGWSPLRFTVLTCIPGAVGLVIANVIAIGVGAAVMPTRRHGRGRRLADPVLRGLHRGARRARLQRRRALARAAERDADAELHPGRRVRHRGGARPQLRADRARRRRGGDRRAGRQQPLLARHQNQPLNAVGFEARGAR